jgi:hypothetical protein
VKTNWRKINAAFLLTASLAATDLLGGQALFGKEPGTDDNGLLARVDQLVQAWEPIAAERRLDDIGWARDIRDALRLAREHGRPVFLFTYSGSAVREHAMALQRC